jgi:hypothetical protein
LGFSPWSGWTGPIAPQVAVTIAQFTPERMAATLTWFAPILSLPTRHVEFYEFQMCCLRGPLTKSIELLTSDVAAHLRDSNLSSNLTSADHSVDGDATRKKKSGSTRRRGEPESSDEEEDSLAWVPLTLDDESEVPDFSSTDKLKTKKIGHDDESNEYVTLRSDLKENVYEVTGLKAGSRYRCRVRCKVSDYPQWNPWDFSVVSEIFSMPATPPDPPFLVRVAVSRSFANAATSAAIVAQEASDCVLDGTAEFLARDAVPFSKQTSAQPSAQVEGSIFDYSLSDLIALGQEVESEAQSAAEAATEQLRWEQAMFGESADGSARAPTAGAIAPVKEVQDTLLPIFTDSTKIRERISRKVSTSGAGAKKQSVAMVTQMYDATLEEMESEQESCGFEDLSFDSRSMRAHAQSITSTAIARKTDVDIKSGKYAPGPAATGLEGTSLSTTTLSAAEGEETLEIMHDSITVSWQNGQANGLPVEEFRVEMARVRTYRLTDVVRAREAYQNVNEADELHDHDDAASHDGSTVRTQQSPTRNLSSILKPSHAVTDTAALASDSLISESVGANSSTYEECWTWQDITTTGGTFVGSQKFRAENLVPGGTYIFRVKQRNACGWSVFSGASRMISTYPSVPPGQPIVFSVRSTLAAVRWAESDHPGIGLTNIEYEVQIGVVPNVLQADVRGVGSASSARKTPDTVWRTIDVRYFPNSDTLLHAMLVENVEDRAAVGSASVVHLAKADAETSCVHVMLHRLVPQLTYMLRVRVRTIVGWSPWSAVSAPFRTKG